MLSVGSFYEKVIDMRVAFRVDASARIGTGHVSRCATLADELRGRGADVIFVCRNLPGNLTVWLKDRGIGVLLLPSTFGGNVSGQPDEPHHASWLEASWEQDAEEAERALKNTWASLDWLIVDHYGIDARWERRLGPLTRRLMVIDDLADRPHDCDLLLDQNLYDDLQRRYQGLVPDHCRTLLGPEFALLRPEFAQARHHLRDRVGEVKCILVFFGGVDATNQTMKALTALEQFRRPDMEVDVVIGQANPHRVQISKYCAGCQNIQLHIQTNRIAQLMAATDLAIGGSGVATWERYALGVPALVIALAYNQVAIAEAAAKSGAIRYLGTHQEVSEAKIREVLRELLATPDALAQMSQAGLTLVDAEGVFRVVNALEETK